MMDIESNMVCGKYVTAKFTIDHASVDTGLMNDTERAVLVEELRRGADEIESWPTIGYTPPTREIE